MDRAHPMVIPELCNWKLMIFLTFELTWGYQMTLGWKSSLHFIVLIIPVNLICYMTMYERKKNILGHPMGLKVTNLVGDLPT